MKERKKEGRKRKRKRGRKGEERGRKIYFPDLKGWNEADLGVILHSPTSRQDLSNHLSSFFFQNNFLRDLERDSMKAPLRVGTDSQLQTEQLKVRIVEHHQGQRKCLRRCRC